MRGGVRGCEREALHEVEVRERGSNWSSPLLSLSASARLLTPFSMSSCDCKPTGITISIAVEALVTQAKQQEMEATRLPLRVVGDREKPLGEIAAELLACDLSTEPSKKNVCSAPTNS